MHSWAEISRPLLFQHLSIFKSSSLLQAFTSPGIVTTFPLKHDGLEDYIYFPFVMIPFQGGLSFSLLGVGGKKNPLSPSPLSTLTLLHLHLRHASGRQGYTVGSHRTCHAIGWPRLCLQRCRHRSRTGPRLHGIGAIGIHLRAVVGETELLGM